MSFADLKSIITRNHLIIFILNMLTFLFLALGTEEYALYIVRDTVADGAAAKRDNRWKTQKTTCSSASTV